MMCATAPQPYTLRWARREDAIEIARLFLISSEGLAAYIWGAQDGGGRSLEEVGAARYSREGADFSYRNCLLAARGQEVLGMIHTFAMRPRTASEVEDDPVLKPYSELEDPGSLYISGLAVYARHRGQGIGGALLDCAEGLALTRALPRLSLICFERNVTALEFYVRRGFEIVDRRPVAPHPTLAYPDGDALLMTRALLAGTDPCDQPS